MTSETSLGMAAERAARSAGGGRIHLFAIDDDSLHPNGRRRQIGANRLRVDDRHALRGAEPELAVRRLARGGLRDVDKLPAAEDAVVAAKAGEVLPPPEVAQSRARTGSSSLDR